MNPRIALLVLAALLTVPSAESAAPDGAVVDKETATIEQNADSLSVSERIDFHVTITSEYQGNWSFQIQPGHQNLRAFAIRNGEEQAVTPFVVEDEVGHDVVYVNLSAVHTGVRTNDTFAIRFEYDVASTYDRYVTSEPAQLIVYAKPDGDEVPSSKELPEFIPTNDGRFHAISEDVPDGYHFQVEFIAVPSDGTSGGTRDMTPYLFGVAGLIIGFLLALFFARRGMIAQKAKKFEKGGAMESRDMLTARRRTLMAALKELELAHDAKEIPDSAYAPLKEEYKAQTVRVMRNLEEKQEPGS